VEAAGGEVTIGRETDRHLVLPSPAVSRRHARLLLDGSQPVVTDDGSSNGVLVEGAPIQGPTPIGAGSRIDIAEYHLLVEELTAIATEPEPEEPATRLRLIAEGGPIDGHVIELGRPRTSFGRAPDNDVPLDHPSISRHHAAVHRIAADQVEIEDLGSSNGSFLNGERVEKAVAAPGDVVRFGELRFRLEGDGAGAQSLPVAGRAAPGPVLAAVAGLLTLAVLVGFAVWAARARSGPRGAEAIAKIAEQEAAHVRAGKQRLADKAFDAAAAEFEQALQLDPGDSEARRLKSLALAEPQNDRLAEQLRVKGKVAFDRASFSSLLPLLQQLPTESSFREPAARDLGTRLTSFGESQCRARQWTNCAWAICAARQVAPPTARALVYSPSSEGALREAEKKLARDRSYHPCPLH
jgi:pSer/pThr/pTyr-binding forkhead associated (FHA) protein